MKLTKVKGSKIENSSYLKSYLEFQKISPNSPTESHARNIMRYYVARAFDKNGFLDISVQTEFVDKNAGLSFLFDVTAVDNYNYYALCFPGSLTEKDIAMLVLLTELEDDKVILVFSNLVSTESLRKKFNLYFENGLFQIKTMVLPPFNDLYEYDIWMFEAIFGDIKK
jgi:hypothetical protein